MEQMIIFAYDTGYCKTEADDPQKAVLFFHPQWVSDQQRLALCGQLMGAAHFCETVFSTPKILTLQCGKFVLKKFGRYILSVGSDQTLPDWILQQRFNSLELLFQFYHNSFEILYNSVECNQEIFSKKLTDILETFIPILQCVVSVFGNVFAVRCPKKNSSAFLEAFQLLETCCNFKGILGGVILHESRIIATQLDPDITKLLALCNKLQIRCLAEDVHISYCLPSGVQLLRVYLKQESYSILYNLSNYKWTIFNGFQKNFTQKAGKIKKKEKEVNKIFTVQEEGSTSDNACSDSVTNNNERLIKDQTSRFKFKKSKTENIFKERSKNYVGNLNIKVCSTPTIEKTVVHDELVSICSGAKAEPQVGNNVTTNFVPDIVQDAIKSKYRSRILAATKYSHNRLFRMSIDDLMIDFTHKSYPSPLKYYIFGMPKTCRETKTSEKMEKREKRMQRRAFYKTIADPMNPVLRFDGVPVSKSLYNTYLDEHYKDFIVANITIDSREEFLKNKYSKNEHFKGETNLSSITVENNTNEGFRQPEPVIEEKENSVNELPNSNKELTRANQKAFRRSLSLPLKPIMNDTEEITAQNSVVKNKVLLARTPTTPLMTRLSLLAFEEQHSADIKPMSTPSDCKIIKNQVPSKDANKNEETVPVCLFVYGVQNMSIMLILDEGLEKNSDVILSLCETSSASLKRVEHLKNKSLVNLPNENDSNSSYSFLSVDDNWGAIQRSGPWDDEQLKTVGSLHHDLNIFTNATEIILRSENSVLYGYSCGGSKIFYQQGGCSSAGLPTPADLMGVVTLKARRRLERDRDVVLL